MSNLLTVTVIPELSDQVLCKARAVLPLQQTGETFVPNMHPNPGQLENQILNHVMSLEEGKKREKEIS